MSPTVLGLFVAGLALLLLGAELLVRGASRLATALSIPPLVIGLTVVAWGTGSPELAVGVKAALAGQPDLTIGNVVGSNIANILLVLGFAAFIVPLKVSERIVRIDVPLMIGASVLTLLLAMDGRLGAFDGLLFITLMVAYTWWTIRASRRQRRAVVAEYEREFGTDGEVHDLHGRWPLFVTYGLMVAGGLFLLVKGSDWLVDGASSIATALGFSELTIGLTIVALGTSLPELATSAVAGIRGHRDIAVGNAVGSNIFNILAVLGVTALVADGGIPVAATALSVDIPIMIAVAIACLPVFFSGYVIDRWSGAVFIALYTGYMAYLVMEGVQHAAVTGFSYFMLALVIPLASFTLVLLAVRSWRRR